MEQIEEQTTGLSGTTWETRTALFFSPESIDGEEPDSLRSSSIQAWYESDLYKDAEKMRTDPELFSTYDSESASVLRDTSGAAHSQVAPTQLGVYASALIHRFERLKERDDLNRAISSLWLAAELTPNNHPKKPVRLRRVAVYLRERFDRHGALCDLSDSIMLQRQAVNLVQDGDSIRPSLLGDLGDTLVTRFKRSRRLDDLDTAISQQKLAVEITSTNQPELPSRLDDLGNMLRRRFEHSGELVDLESALSALRRAVELANDGDSIKPVVLGNLAIALRHRFNRLHVREDLDSAIVSQRLCVSLSTESVSDRHTRFERLVESLLVRFKLSHHLEDLNEIIIMLRRAVEVVPENHEAMPFLLNELGNSLRTRHEFMRQNQSDDIESAVRAQQQAVDLASDDHPQRVVFMGDLKRSLLLRFRLNPSELDSAILTQREAVELIADDRIKASPLEELGDLLMTRFKQFERIDDLNEAIALRSRAVEVTSDVDHDAVSRRLDALGNSLRRRFGLPPHRVDDIENSIRTHRRAVDLVSDHGLTKKMVSVNSNFVIALAHRFQRLGGNNNLDDLISARRDLVALMSDKESDRSSQISELGEHLITRFKRFKRIEDLDEAIALQSRAVEAISYAAENDTVTRLDALGNSLRRRFGLPPHRVDDIENSIRAHRRAVEFASEHGLMKEMIFVNSNLVIALAHRFQRLGGSSNLDDLISARRAQVELTADTDAEKPLRLILLGDILMDRFKRLKQPDDLDAAISAQRRALELTADKPPSSARASQLSELGDRLVQRFKRLESIDDIHEAISTQQRAVQLTPAAHNNLPGRLDELANSFRRRFVRLHHLSDIDEAISLHRRAIDLAPQNQPARIGFVGNLAVALSHRYQRLGAIDDLNDLVSAQRIEVNDKPDDRLDRSLRRRIALADSLTDRFKRLALLDDLDEAITHQRCALDATPEGDKTKPARCNDLVLSLMMRYRRLRESKDIESAEFLLQHALDLAPDSDTWKPILLGNLGYCSILRVADTGDISNIDSAIDMQRRAANATPAVKHKRSEMLLRLGITLQGRLAYDRTQSGFNLAIEGFRSSRADRTTTHPILRLQSSARSAMMTIEHTELSSPGSLMEDYSCMFDTLSEIAWLGHSAVRRYARSAQLRRLVDHAATFAIQFGLLQCAVEWLEAGKSFISAMEGLPSHDVYLDKLSKDRVDLADSLRENRQLLQPKPFGHALKQSDPLTDNISDDGLFGVVADALMEDPHLSGSLLHKYQRLLNEIRALPRLETFLLPSAFTDFAQSLEDADGPVIMIHLSELSCHALSMLQDGSILPIVLPEITRDRARSLRNEWMLYLARNRDYAQGETDIYAQTTEAARLVLRHLWVWIARPVLRALEFLNNIAPYRLPHVTWCLDGDLAQLPLHAAGVYDGADERGPRVYDFVVSSYISSLSDLLRCRRPAVDNPTPPNVIVVTPQESMDWTPLPGSRSESTVIQDTFPQSMCACLPQEKATIASVLATLDEPSWVHFACTGSQDADGDPSKCSLTLHDGNLSLSAFRDRRELRAELAFLSMNQSAASNADDLRGYAHFATGLLGAGFSGVVAKMWGVEGAATLVAVEVYYRRLYELRISRAVGKGETGAAYALHDAVKVLRETTGVNDFAQWAQFMHFGI